MTETDILRACLDLLRLRCPHLLWWRQNAGIIPTPDGGYRRFIGRKGLPDIWLILPPHGTLVAIEVKKPGGKLSPDQKDFHEALVKAGGVSCVVTSVDELERDLAQVL